MDSGWISVLYLTWKECRVFLPLLDSLFFVLLLILLWCNVILHCLMLFSDSLLPSLSNLIDCKLLFLLKYSSISILQNWNYFQFWYISIFYNVVIVSLLSMIYRCVHRLGKYCTTEPNSHHVNCKDSESESVPSNLDCDCKLHEVRMFGTIGCLVVTSNNGQWIHQ